MHDELIPISVAVTKANKVLKQPTPLPCTMEQVALVCEKRLDTAVDLWLDPVNRTDALLLQIKELFCIMSSVGHLPATRPQDLRTVIFKDVATSDLVCTHPTCSNKQMCPCNTLSLVKLSTGKCAWVYNLIHFKTVSLSDSTVVATPSFILNPRIGMLPYIMLMANKLDIWKPLSANSPRVFTNTDGIDVSHSHN